MTRLHFWVTAILFWLLTLSFQGCVGSVPANYDTERWVDEVLLHDGRSTNVSRTYRGSRQPETLTGIFASVLFKAYNHFDLILINPDNAKKIYWSGGNGIEPIMFDIFDGVPYLVVYANNQFSEVSPYGCIAIPFIILRYENKSEKWVVADSSQASRQFRANLWSGDRSPKNKSRNSTEWIQTQNILREKYSQGLFSVLIPKNFDDWKYVDKDKFKYQPNLEGCYPPKAQPIDDRTHPQHPSAPARLIDVEVLETKEYSPVWKISEQHHGEKSRWSDLVWDEESDALCKQLLTREDSGTPWMQTWILFSNDSEKTNRARYTGTPICKSNGIWFPDYSNGPGTLYLAKFSLAGEFQYRIRIVPPTPAYGYVGHMGKSFTALNGYLYFEWWHSNQAGHDRLVHKTAKFRIKEPQPALSK